ncbi:hypothetical protein LINGRAHAP2_LOCUS14225 [Linum grandiflorum]
MSLGHHHHLSGLLSISIGLLFPRPEEQLPKACSVILMDATCSLFDKTGDLLNHQD